MWRSDDGSLARRPGGKVSVPSEPTPTSGGRIAGVVDISVLGAAVLVGDAPMSDLAGKTLTVRVAPLTGGSVSLTFVGAVRNVTARVGTGMRIGIEFVGLSEMERSIMNALEVIEAVW